MTFLLENPELLRAFKQGGQAAMAAVYKQYVPLVAEIAMKGFTFQSAGRTMRFYGTPSRFAVDDVIADVFVRAFKPSARESYDGLHPYASYLRTITRNCIIDRQRKKDPLNERVKELRDDESAELPERQDLEDPATSLEQKELFGLAQEFVNSLPAREQGVVQKRFMDGLSRADVAKALGMSAPTARKLERKVLKQFFKYMKKRGYFEKVEPPQSLGSALISLLALGALA